MPKPPPSSPAIDVRTLAKAAGAAQRVSGEVAALVHLTDALGLPIGRQGRAVMEELDLLRHFIREATLASVIHAAPEQPTAPAAEALQRQRTRKATDTAGKLSKARALTRRPKGAKK
jgi:hypothetical protein